MEIDKIDILKRMIRIRMVEQYIAKRYPEQKMRCPTHLCLGQEAVPAVFGYFAKNEDIFVGTCRSHGHYLAKGGDLTALFAELLGRTKGCSKGFGGSMHIIDLEKKFWGTSAIVAGGVPISAGAAFSIKYLKLPQVVVAFMGDAALEEGVVYETVNFCLLHNLPIIFVCENNHLAITTPIELRQCSTTLFNRFQTMGLKGIYVAENDISKMINVAKEGYEFTRSGLGPVFIEYVVSRWSVHVGHDFEGPVDYWWQDPVDSDAYSCPICVLIKELLNEKKIDMEKVREIKEEITLEIENSYERAEESLSSSNDEISRFVYASALESILPQTKNEYADKKFSYIEQSKLINPF